MSREAVAICSIGAVFPGCAELDDFWTLIRDGRSAAREVPADRWAIPPSEARSRVKGEADRVGSIRACLLDALPMEELDGLPIDRERLHGLDPLFSLALIAAGRALRGARIESVDRERFGVMIGNIVLPTDHSSALSDELLSELLDEPLRRLRRDFEAVDPLDRYSAGLPGGLIASTFDLHGGARTLDAACAASLYAVALAARELQEGRLDAVLSGGLSRPSCLYTQMGFSQLGAVSPSGRCAPFSAAADGLVVGEGAGFFVLKRLSDAVAAGDTIHGVLRGVGLSNDIGGSLFAPDSEGQLRAMKAAYASAGWSPGDVQLIECHGTGTLLGDATEFQSLCELWSEESWWPGQAVIGSVKSNVGHLLTGAGAAGLSKVLLAMRHAELPPTASFVEPAPALTEDDTPFRVLGEAEAWQPADGGPRRAAVSAFGFGGINAHLLIEQWAGEESEFEAEPAADMASEHAEATEDDGTEDEAVVIVGLDARVGPFDSLEVLTARFEGRDDHEPEEPAAPLWSALRERGLSRAGFAADEISIPYGLFRIPPKELEASLPQQLLMLLAARGALDSASWDGERDDRCGVFIGVGQDQVTSQFHWRWSMAERVRAVLAERGVTLSPEELEAKVQEVRDAVAPALTADRTMGALGGIVASRVAREFRCGGPSFTLSAEDASGLVALDTATRLLRAGELDRAIVGAVEVGTDPRAWLAADAAHGETPDGACDAAVALVLMRESDARAAGLDVIARVAGVGAAGGAGAWLPEVEATRLQSAVDRALGEAGLERGDPDLIVLRGSGLADEGAAEHALVTALARERQGTPCAAVPCMPATGHGEAASGLISLAMAAQALRRRRLPAAPALVGLSEELQVLAQDGALVWPRETQYWIRNRETGPRRALVTATGVEGTAVAVVLEEDPARELAPSVASRPEGGLFVFTGADEAELVEVLDAFDVWLADTRERDVDRLATRRYREGADETPSESADGDSGGPDGGARLAIVAVDRRDLEVRVRQARARLDGEQPRPDRGPGGVFWRGDAALGPEAEVAFVYPGSGNHRLGMGRGLSRLFPEFFERQDGENRRLADQMMTALFWNDDLDAASIDQRHQELILGQVSHGTVATDLLRGFGLRPGAVVGYSLGESAAFFGARIWRDRDEILERVLSSSLFSDDMAGRLDAVRAAWGEPDDAEIRWTVGIVDRPREVVEAALESRPRAYRLIVNTPGECVVGGDPEQVRGLVEELDCHFFELPGITAVHCEVAEPVAEPYLALHTLPTAIPEELAGLKVYSGARTTSYEVDSDSAARSVLAQARDGVDFPGVISQAWQDGARIFVEVGPGNSCTRMIPRILEDKPHLAVALSARGLDEGQGLLRLLAALAAEGVRLKLDRLYGAESSASPASDNRAPQIALRLPVGAPAPGPLPSLVSATSVHRPSATPSAAEPVAVSASMGVADRAERSSMVSSASGAAGRAAVGSGSAALASRAAVGPPASASGMASPSGATPRAGVSSARLAAYEQVQSTIEGALAVEQTRMNAHSAFQRRSAELEAALVAQTQLQMQLAILAGAGTPVGNGAGVAAPSAPGSPPQQGSVPPVARPAGLPPAPVAGPRPPEPAGLESGPRPDGSPPRSLNFEACMRYATGQVGDVLGPMFAKADQHPTRVRLPDEPLMLCHRILSIEGEPLSMSTGRLVTEHDVVGGAWYLDEGCAPVCISVESGQADLFLSGFLGIDLQGEGEAVYRLLDAVVSFHRSLPRAGETIRYDIRINEFFRQGSTWLFRFEFDASIDGVPLMTMRRGCAGFFTEAELAAGQGIIHSRLDMRPMPGTLPEDWREPVALAEESIDDRRLDALRAGDLATAFGPAFANLSLTRVSTIPGRRWQGDRMKLIDRITRITPGAGRYGLGQIVGELDIAPDDWFLTCHFVDDQVMPGTLMYECCMHTLRVYLMRMGWLGEAGAVTYEPVVGVQSRLKCRGQVVAGTRKSAFEITIKELGYGPEPFVIADALMSADGRPIVEITDMSLRLVGLDQAMVEANSRAVSSGITPGIVSTAPPAVSAPIAPASGPVELPPARPAIFTKEQILAYAVGKPSEGFGEPYRVFDEDRILARLPGPPYLFMDRVVELDGCRPFVMEAGGRVVAEYDVPPEEWYFKESGGENGGVSRGAGMPFAVLLEVALQPCGWLAAYCGSGLTSDVDLSFRNLGGQAVQHLVPGSDIGRLTTTVKMTRASMSGGMIIQHYDLRVDSPQGLVYEGDTYFGFFTKAALADQVGVRDAEPWRPDEAEQARAVAMAAGVGAPYSGDMLRMFDEVTCWVPDGGPHGLGYIEGVKTVDPMEWFFAAHFYQDPVCPGSLGLESFMQLLMQVAGDRWGDGPGVRFESMAVGQPHRWVYRGQILPSDREVRVQAVIREIDEAARELVADGFLEVDGRIIYEMRDFRLGWRSDA